MSETIRLVHSLIITNRWLILHINTDTPHVTTYTRLFKYQLLQLSRTNLSLIFLTSNGKKNYFEYKLQSSYNLILQLIWLIHQQGYKSICTYISYIAIKLLSVWQRTQVHDFMPKSINILVNYSMEIK